ncbi:MAG TPA: ABC transporter ATP-binding protein [Bryobacteraceae bacterium]|nr:ABC transporter ATP-binding protein [Bryobacteraceae bacterium]
MAAASTLKKSEPVRSKGSEHHVTLENVGVRYTLLTEDQRTLKGRLSSLISGAPESANFWALRNINLKIKSGDIVGVVGRNGSGKSTLLRAISGIIEPTEGKLQAEGRLLPMLELGAAFNGELTGRENVYLNCALLNFTRDQTERMIPEIISFSELGMFFDVPVKTYSSGMAARLAFAMSTQVEPDIIILDEVLGVGDETFQKKSYFRLRKLMEAGTIVLLVSHSSAVIEQLCNRVVYLSRGKVEADGPARQVLNHYQREAAAGL